MIDTDFTSITTAGFRSPSSSSMNRLNPDPPYAWPDPRVSEGLADYELQTPCCSMAERAKTVLVVVSDLTDTGVALLAKWLEANSRLNAWVVVAPYPTGPTTKDHFIGLLELTARCPGRLEIRVLPLNKISDRVGNVICFSEANENSVHLAIGPTGNFGCEKAVAGQINLTFAADSLLTNSFKESFDYLWSQSTPLDLETTAQIPFLVVPPGTHEAAEAWRKYLECCSFKATDHSPVSVDQMTGKVTILGQNGAPEESPSEKAGLPRMDELAEFVARLYEKGSLASIDKLSRIPPLDTPIDPSWLGERSEIQQGSVTRRVEMRVSVIDEETLKQIEKHRTALSKTLPRFSLGLADNMRWIPDAARPLLDLELNRLASAGQAIIGKLVKGDVKAFLESKREKLEINLNEVLAELGHKGKVSEETVELVMDRLRQRLEKAQSSNFLPRLTFSRIRFVAREDTFSSPWGQAFSLLKDLAAFPRKVISDSFFLRGIEVPEDELLDAMNIAGDVVIRDRNSSGIRDFCKAGLGFLSKLEKASIDARKRCELVHGLIIGRSLDELATTLDRCHPDGE